jgi:hypothetical protein
MKNIYTIATDKPSRIYLVKSNNRLGITSNNPEFTENFGSGTQNQHVYITSGQEIKDGEYYLYLEDNSVQKFIKREHTKLLRLDIQKKIILTTDAELIKDNVQAIDDGFLDWLVKNPSCESVAVGSSLKSSLNDGEKYCIMVPKEEVFLQSSIDGEVILGEKPKQEIFKEAFKNYGKQKKIEEAATNYSNKKHSSKDLIADEAWYEAWLGFRNGAKWEQEQYELLLIELNHTKTLLASCEKALDDSFEKQERICNSEVIQRIRASKSDAEARRIIRTI